MTSTRSLASLTALALAFGSVSVLAQSSTTSTGNSTYGTTGATPAAGTSGPTGTAGTRQPQPPTGNNADPGRDPVPRPAPVTDQTSPRTKASTDAGAIDSSDRKRMGNNADPGMPQNATGAAPVTDQHKGQTATKSKRKVDTTAARTMPATGASGNMAMPDPHGDSRRTGTMNPGSSTTGTPTTANQTGRTNPSDTQGNSTGAR